VQHAPSRRSLSRSTSHPTLSAGTWLERSASDSSVPANTRYFLSSTLTGISPQPPALNEKGVKVSRRFPPGTVVIAIVGATIGMTAILEVDVYCSDSVVEIQVNPKAAISTRYGRFGFRCPRSPYNRSSPPWLSEWSVCVRCSERRCVRLNTSSPRSSTAPSAVDRTRSQIGHPSSTRVEPVARQNRRPVRGRREGVHHDRAPVSASRRSRPPLAARTGAIIASHHPEKVASSGMIYNPFNKE